MATQRTRRNLSLALVAATVISLAGASTVAGQEGTPTPTGARPVADASTSTAWPSGDGLRRDLQDIGFSFRADRGTGDWLGWAPRATLIEAPAITLGADGSAPAWARATFETLEVDLLGGDVDGALTALLEIASRTPLPGKAVSRAYRFIVDELLVEAPVLQAECYATALPEGVIVIRLDTETGSASVLLAERAAAHPDGDAIDECSAVSTRIQELESSRSRDERVRITATADGAFEPADISLEGPIVTVVLTVTNDASVERTLTFAPPLEATTGPLAPGESRLIIVRRLEVGEYAFGDPDDPEGPGGLIRVTALQE